MKRKFLVLELLLAAQVSLKVLIPALFSWKVSLASFGALSLLKGAVEGYRLSWVYFPIAGVLSVLPLPYIPYLAIPTVLYPILKYPMFKHLKPKGPYLPGFRQTWINNESVNISVYHPTTHKGPDSLQFASKIKPWKNLHDSVRVHQGKMPLWYAKIGCSYLNHWKLGVNTNVPIVPIFSTERRSFPVIIFSHGMATGRNDYSFYLKELSSRGYIVVSPDHSDIVYPPSGQFLDFEHRNQDMEKRLVDLQKVLDFVYDPNGLQKMFGEQGIELDLTRVSVMGHSYGGCSATYLALRDPRVTGACINLDPWYFALPESEYKAMDRPYLALTTKAFGDILPDNRKAVIKMARLNENFKEESLVGYFEHAFHNNLADNGFFMPRELEEKSALGPVALVKKHFRNHTAVIESFLEVFVLERNEGQKRTKEEVLERARGKVYFHDVKFHPEDLSLNGEPNPRL